ncbi:MAG: hypothetical protein A3H35_15945 [Betaproteobacteria bacterium RIFCSPLOWO2_02_FULL_62_17]|nr:MAG: hypothetical protein A3H35_15945 [Betaproteobacteria bacterium RIFCSPLOWO2_02_FULL_62_17]
MRVLNVSALLDPVTGGGTAERTIQLSRAFARHGWETTALCIDTGFDRQALRTRLGGARLEALPCWNSRFLIPATGMSRLRSLVEAADIVHTCNHWTLLNLLVSREAKRAGRPWVVCPSGALPMMDRSLILKRIYNVLAGRSQVHDAAGWVAITARETQSFREYGVEPNEITVIPNGIDPDDYLVADTGGFRRRHNLGAKPVILFLGRLAPVKGPDLLLEAFVRSESRFRDWLLVFAGPDGGELSALRNRAAALGERVRFLGHVALADKASALKTASLVVVPSRSEAMSLVALEAGACGTPVLMTTECGFDDLPASGGGELVAANYQALAEGMERMIGAAAELAPRGAKLREYILSRYTWNYMVERYQALFESILKKPAAA